MRLILGHPDGRISQNLEALGAYLRADDFTVEVTEHIRRGIWSKLQMVVLFGTDRLPHRHGAEMGLRGAGL